MVTAQYREAHGWMNARWVAEREGTCFLKPQVFECLRKVCHALMAAFSTLLISPEHIKSNVVSDEQE